ncbi:MAG TPA: nucleotidyl transferase AbiEii/AbiGii toxin family protein [Exilispira sp.]|nr:nucleotidyl transferase AbiEii/AbiGii toxin family protein [Exilispira sp.]
MNLNKIYDLQDKVLSNIFSFENIFYLTGGTCLNRFYIEKRYSEDLDLFTNNNPRFGFAIKNIIKKLEESFTVQIEIEAKNFFRLKVENTLQVIFVNDIEYRVGEIVITKNKFLIDNVYNILSNKLTAVIGRDNPKDIFDIYLIAKYFSFSWDEILNAAHKKEIFNDDDLIIRLKSFPKELFININILDITFLDNFDKDFLTLIDEIYYRKYHFKMDK